MKKKRIVLKEGHVILLKKGMTVEGKIPEMFVYDNRKVSTELITSEVKIGKNYKNDLNIDPQIKKVAQRIHESFEEYAFPLSYAKAFAFVKDNVVKPTPQSFRLDGGEFVVIKTSTESSGTGHGRGDSYPDSELVICKRLKNGQWDKDGDEVRFYQSGCKSAMITNLEPIRMMRMHMK